MAKLRGIENTPAPTMPPTTIAVSAPREIFSSATRHPPMRLDDSGHAVFVASKL
jgi:hypothetical protein